MTLREIRMRRRMTASHVARVLRVSRMTLHRWERGVCAPDTVHLVSMSRLYDVRFADLVDAIYREGVR